jgi:hypothetical protein
LKWTSIIDLKVSSLKIRVNLIIIILITITIIRATI